MAAKPTPPDSDATETTDASARDTTPGAPDGAGAARPGTGSPAGGNSADDAPTGGNTAGGALGNDTAGRYPDSSSAAASGFFGWLRALGVPRQPGWLGGVCSGVAARLGIDPIIVRGVLVVFALFGAPVFLIYGIAWLLLPDTTGRIHLEDVFHGVFTRALVGIAIFLLIGLVPGSSSWPFVFAPTDLFPWSFGGWVSWIGVFWTLLLIGGVAALVIWLARRGAAGQPPAYGAPAQSPEPSEATTTTTTDAAAPTAATAVAATAAALVAGASVPPPPGTPGSVTAPGAPVEPAPPAAAVGTDEYASWKAQHDAWRTEHEAWKRSQADAGRAARAQLAAENKARAAQFAAQAEEARRVRRATRPRTSFAYVVATLGAALVAGTVAAIVALGAPSAAEFAGPIALSVAALVTALAMVLAGILRRRSGFLAFVTVALLVVTLGAAAAPRDSELLFGSQGIPIDRSASYISPFGDVYIDAAPDLVSSDAPAHIEISQITGDVWIGVRGDVRLAVEADFASGYLQVDRFDADGNALGSRGIARLQYSDGRDHEAVVIGRGTTPGETDAYITVRGARGRVIISQMNQMEENR